MYEPKQQAENLIEIPNLRGATYKVYSDNGRMLRVYHCKDIHYRPYNRENWEERDVRLALSNDKYLASENKYTIGFRRDQRSLKYVGIRRAGTNNIQLEFTYDHVTINSKIVEWPDWHPHVNYSNNYMEHIVNDNISVCTDVDNNKVVSSLRLKYRVIDFEIVLKVHLKGLEVGNEFIEKDGVKHYIPIDGKFYFCSDEEDNTLWINTPKMWNSLSISFGIDHYLYEKNGELLYRKVPNQEGTRWLAFSKPDVYIDANTYYSTTADGYVLCTNSAWATARSATTGTEANSTATSYTSGIAGAYVSKKYNICRSFFSFNTSTISIYSWVQAIQLGIRGLGSGYTSNSASCVKGTQADTLTTADFSACTGDEYAYVSSWSTTGYNLFTFSKQGVLNLNRSGTTKVCVRERAHDYSNVTPTTTDGINGVYYAENPAEANDPYLLIYEVPAPTILNGTSM